jgi:hypothetical protein
MKTVVNSKVFLKWRRAVASCENSCVGWFCLCGSETCRFHGAVPRVFMIKVIITVWSDWSRNGCGILSSSMQNVIGSLGGRLEAD